MSGRPIRKLLVVAALAALVAAVVKALRGKPAPQFSNHPTVTGGPVAWPEPRSAPPEAVVAEPVAHADELGPVEVEVQAALDAEAEAPHVDPATEAATSWVEPVEGSCPDGYPIKAKLKSGIFHQPGGLAYERTVPDRCYASAEAAEADGLRAAKR